MGQLTTHVLDTASGRPATGVEFVLHRLGSTRELVSRGRTNADGRADQPLLSGDSFIAGTYELTFFVGAYFSSTGVPTSNAPFLDEVPLRFTLTADEHYHVPLLVSPWSYSTYRGS
ncbi:MAG: hydroxyisourate hydrolase [Pseudomonadota bacterium]